MPGFWDSASVPHHDREIRADLLFRRNVEALIRARKINQKDLAFWCGHKTPWLSKILSGTRGIQLEDVGRIADFFGLTTAQLFQRSINDLFERRRAQRRSGRDRRSGAERRKAKE